MNYNDILETNNLYPNFSDTIGIFDFIFSDDLVCNDMGGEYYFDAEELIFVEYFYTLSECEDPDENDFELNFNQTIANDSGSFPYVLTMELTSSSENSSLKLTNLSGDYALFGREALSNPNFTQQSLAIYPNPTNNSLNISIDSLNSNYSIFSIEGKLIIDNVKLKSAIDVSQLKSGIYFLKIDNQQAVKFIKE